MASNAERNMNYNTAILEQYDVSGTTLFGMGQMGLRFSTVAPNASKEVSAPMGVANLPIESDDHESIPFFYAEPNYTENMVRTVDFRHPEHCAQTRPRTCTINGQAIFPSKQKWSQLLVAITEKFIAEKNPNIIKLDREPLHRSREFFLPYKADHGTCHRLSNGKWIYTKYDAPVIVAIIGRLCRYCDVDLGEVIISYESKDGNVQKTERYVTLNNVSDEMQPDFGIDNNSGFHTWLEKENYARNTVENYCRALSLIFRKYQTRVQKAFDESDNRLQAVRKLIEWLNNNEEFVSWNQLKHNQYSAALAAWERYYASGYYEDAIVGTQTKKVAATTFMKQTSYFERVVDLEEGKVGIRRILIAHFQSLYGYSNINILWDTVQNELPMFLNDNAINTANDLWRFVDRVFGSEFVLSKPHIWQTVPSYPRNVQGLVINLARQHGGVVTREQIDDFFVRIKMDSPRNATLILRNYLLFCDKATLTPTDSQNVNHERCDAITKALKGLFTAENMPYIVLRDIKMEWFSCLPEPQNCANWTPLLLQEVLRVCPSINFRTILPNLKGQDFDTVGAAIVPNDSDITTFADIVHRYCYAKYNLPHKLSAEDLRRELRDARMIEGNELINNMHKALKDYRFAFDNEKQYVKILEC